MFTLQDNPDFAKDVADIEVAIRSLSPTSTQLAWHQDQAGIIPNSCRESAKYSGDGTQSPAVS